MVRVGAAVVAMEVAALALATLLFGWVALVVGAPALLATGVVLAALWVTRGRVRRLQERRAARFEPDGPERSGLMSELASESSTQCLRAAPTERSEGVR